MMQFIQNVNKICQWGWATKKDRKNMYKMCEALNAIYPICNMIKRLFNQSYQPILRLNHQKFSHVLGSKYASPIQKCTAQLLRQAAELNPSRMALHSYDQQVSLTYSQVYEKAAELATGLVTNFKLKPKDRVGIYSYNKWEWHILQMAAALADLILVNINPAYQSQQLAYTIEKVGLSVLVLSDHFKHLDYLKIVRAIAPQIGKQSAFDLKNQKFPLLKGFCRINVGQQRVEGFVNFSDLMGHKNENIFPKHIDVHSAANIQFTSGTTGLPKAATLSHFNIINNGFLIGERTKYTSVDNICIPVPFYHCFGMIMGNLAALTRHGSLTIVCEGFDPKKTLEAVQKYKATSIYGVPTMFIEYIRNYQANPSKYNIESLRAGIIAGALCSEALMTKILTVLKLKDITNCYGMTETSPVSFQTKPDDTLVQKTTTVGTILPGLQAKIVNTEGKLCKVGEAGEFWVRGWSVMLEYWGDKNATDKSIQDGWMKSGDVGVLDQDGYLSIVGRIKDMIIRGGENIYPKEIEEYLAKMPNILDAQVIGITDQKYGQQVAVVIKVKDLNQNKVTSQQILQFCRDKIAFYKIPRYVKFVTEYPMTVSGKVQKYILRNEFQEEKRKGGLDNYKVKLH